MLPYLNKFLLFVFFVFIFCNSFAQTSKKKEEKESQLTVGAYFPGIGFSIWSMKSDNLHYYATHANKGYISKSFVGNGLNIIYCFDVMYAYKRIKAGFIVGQEYFHISKFMNHEHHFPLEPIFIYNEQMHFHKFLFEAEYSLNKKNKNVSFNIQSGWLLPERTFVHKYIQSVFTLNMGPVFSIPVSDRTTFITRTYFDYKYLSHEVRQSNDYQIIQFDQNNPDRLLKNNIYSFTVYFGLRVNLLKVEKYPVRSPRYSIKD